MSTIPPRPNLADLPRPIESVPMRERWIWAAVGLSVIAVASLPMLISLGEGAKPFSYTAARDLAVAEWWMVRASATLSMVVLMSCLLPAWSREPRWVVISASVLSAVMALETYLLLMPLAAALTASLGAVFTLLMPLLLWRFARPQLEFAQTIFAADDGEPDVSRRQAWRRLNYPLANDALVPRAVVGVLWSGLSIATVLLLSGPDQYAHQRARVVAREAVEAFAVDYLAEVKAGAVALPDTRIFPTDPAQPEFELTVRVREEDGAVVLYGTGSWGIAIEITDDEVVWTDLVEKLFGGQLFGP